MKPDRVVIGVEPEDQRATELMRELYGPFTRTGAPILTMSTESAELCKYAANSILATRISFMNEIANVCELVGADVDHVRKAIGSDRRIGTSFLFPGVGYGGSCFPKDTQALLKSAQDKGYDFKILRAVEEVNDRQKERLVDKIEANIPDLKGKTIAIWGLAFKPRTDDMREAPAIPIIERLLARGVHVKAYDPAAAPVARGIFGQRIALCDKSYDALAGADALAIVTEWNEFRDPDFEKMAAHFGTLAGRQIALWGLAFKPRTDDMREAPAITIVERLLELGATVRAYDPEAAATAKRLFDGRITICDKGYDTLTGSDALAIVTEWNEFREPDFERMRRLMLSPVVFDGRNIYSPEHMRELGFTYFSIGR